MSERTAGMWTSAADCEKPPAKIEAELAALNQTADWDRENLGSVM